MMELIKYFMAHGLEILAAVNALLVALIALFAFIPGEQPEKFLQSVVDLVSKVSRK